MRTVCLVCAAMIGSVYDLARFFVNGNDLFDLAISFAVGLLMCYISFGGYRFAKTALVFLGTAALLGGAMFAVYYFLGSFHSDLFGNIRGYAYAHIPLWLFAVLAAVSLLLSWIFSYYGREKTEKEEITVTAVYRGKRAEIRLLLDSGNLVREPISGKSVFIIRTEAAQALLPAEVLRAVQQQNSAFLLSRHFRLIGAEGIDGNRRIFYGFLPDRLYFENKGNKVELDAYLAIDGGEHRFADCDGIAHPAAISE